MSAGQEDAWGDGMVDLARDPLEGRGERPQGGAQIDKDFYKQPAIPLAMRGEAHAMRGALDALQQQAVRREWEPVVEPGGGELDQGSARSRSVQGGTAQGTRRGVGGVLQQIGQQH